MSACALLQVACAQPIVLRVHLLTRQLPQLPGHCARPLLRGGCGRSTASGRELPPHRCAGCGPYSTALKQSPLLFESLARAPAVLLLPPRVCGGSCVLPAWHFCWQRDHVGIRHGCGRAGMGYLGAAQAVSVSNGVQLCGLWVCMLVGKVGDAPDLCACDETASCTMPRMSMPLQSRQRGCCAAVCKESQACVQ